MIDQLSMTIKSLAAIRIKGAVGLKVVELSVSQPRHQDTPDISPAIFAGIQRNHFRRLWIIGMVIEQDSHRCGRSAVDHKLHSALAIDPTFAACKTLAQQAPVGQRMAKLQWRQC